MKRFALSATVALSTLFAATSALAHHGWNEYDTNTPLTLRGTIQESSYVQPHGTIRLQTTDKTWTVVLAPPSRMESRGLSMEMLAKGKQAEVVAYASRKDAQEARAEQITIDGKTIQLR